MYFVYILIINKVFWKPRISVGNETIRQNVTRRFYGQRFIKRQST